MDGVVNKGRDNASPDRYHYNDKWSNPSDRFDLYYVDPELAARVSALVADFDLRIVSMLNLLLTFTSGLLFVPRGFK